MRRVLVALVLVALVAPGASAQMPDPRQMSGVPLPTGEIPAGTVTVRVVRGTLTNLVTSHPVELVGQVQATGKTNEQGRAEFSGLTIGATVRAVTTVDGQRLESQEFSVAAERRRPRHAGGHRSGRREQRVCEQRSG